MGGSKDTLKSYVAARGAVIAVKDFGNAIVGSVFAVLDPAEPYDGYAYSDILPGPTFLFDQLLVTAGNTIKAGDLLYIEEPVVRLPAHQHPAPLPLHAARRTRPPPACAHRR